MKLKKIASLALAGVMAVSMLAGCATKGGTTNEDATVVTTSNSAVTAFNDSQSAANSVKVVFSSDAKLDAALAQAVKAAPTGNAAAIGGMIQKITALPYTENVTAATFNNLEPGKNDSETVMTVLVYTDNVLSGGVMNEDAAVKKAANAVDSVIADLEKDDGTTNKATYLAYDYTGSVSVVTSKTSLGTTYYVAVVGTKAATEKALTEKDA